MKLSRDAVRGKAQTVLGLLDPAELGQTLMHEHLLWDLRRPAVAEAADHGPEITLCNCFRINYGKPMVPRNMVLRCVDTAAEEVRTMVRAGGRTLVELTCGGLQPDPEGLASVSRKSGAHVIMGCGYYVEEFQGTRNSARSADDLAAEMIGDLFEGAWKTQIRAGIIGEIGCQSPWTEIERKVMRGAVIAQQASGASINVHPGRHPDQPQEVADFVRDAGGNLERLIISHIDRTIFDEERMLRLADTGVVLEFDLFGQEQTYYPWAPSVDIPNDGVRLKWLRLLIDHGHLERIVISHDICYLTRLTKFGGHGYGHIFENVVPMMLDRGFSQREIEAITVDNPRRLLTFV